MIRGLIFDMDGVLADSEPLQARAWVETLERYGIRVDERYFDRWIGIPNGDLAVDLVARFRIPAAPEQISAERQALYLRLAESELAPFPGLAESLAGLALPKAVATSSTRADATLMLARTGLAPHFRVVVTVDDVTATKPDPEIYVKAAAGLGLSPGDCAAIEDSPAGVASARAAGCYVVAVTTTHPATRLAAAHEISASTVGALAALRAAGRLDPGGRG
jgi:sugar-phosphatase